MEQDQLVGIARDVGDAEPLVVLLKGHLWIERWLTDMLTEVLPRPEEVDVEKMNFAMKLALVAAHDLIRPDDVPAFKRLNRMRNNAAHNLNAQPGESEVRILMSTLGPDLRKRVQSAPQAGFHGWEGQLKACVLSMLMKLAQEREAFNKARGRTDGSLAWLRSLKFGPGAAVVTTTMS